MNKKIIILVIVTLMLLLGLTAVVSADEPYELTASDVFYEELDDGTIRITGYRSDYTDIIIPQTIAGKTVTKIGDPYSSDRSMPFLEKDLTSVVIPDTVTYIGYSAFAQNDNLTDVTLGSNLEVIDERAFFSDKISNINIPDKVTTIGQAAFDYNSLKSVEIPDSVTTIGEFAFDRNELTNVTLSKNITRIENNTFANNHLENIIIPENVTYIGDSAFGSNQIQEIIIPENVTHIGGGAFSNNQLQEIDIPENVTYIGRYAFQKNQLQEIDIPQNAVEIGIFAFAENELHTISWNDNEVIPEGIFSVNNMKDFVIPDVVTKIGKEAFSFNKLETIEFGDNVESIGEEAFANYIRNDHKVNAEEYNHISNLEIPDSVISIGDKAFFNNQLETIILGNNLESIGEQAFQYNLISNLEISDSVTSIGNKAFYYNEQMESVDLGVGVQTIGYCAFRGNSIKEITIPESVQTVNDRAFFNNNLTKVTVENKDTVLNGGKYGVFGLQNEVFMPDWYKNKEYEGGVINRICNDERTGPVTYYAYYTVNVTFEENGGSEVTGDVTDKVAHTLLAEPEEPTKEGYEFGGWYIDDGTFDDQWDFDNDTLTQDMTLYAKWNIKQYTVTFKDYDGSTIDTETVTHGSDATAPTDPTREGYTFNSWDTGYTNVTSDLTVTAQYDVNQYTINFESNGGSLVNAINADYNTTVDEPSEPTKEGYIFLGWYKDTGLTNQWNFSTDKIPAEDITLYAKWISSDSITLIPTPSIVEVDSNFNQLFTLEITNDTVIKSVYESDLSLGGVFSSLNIDNVDNTSTTVTARVYGDLNNEGTATITLDDDILQVRNSPLSANIQVNPKPTYTVTFKDYDEAVLKTETVTHGEGAEGLTAPEREGYTFTGWDKEYSNITSDTIVTAQYSINEYKVTFNSNEGSTVEEATSEYNTKITEPTAPTKEGYTFAGWYKEAELTTLWDFANDKAPAEDKTLYAKWEKINSNNNDSDDDSDNSSSGGKEPTEENNEDTTIIVNGEKESAGKEKVEEKDGKKEVVVTVDSEKTNKKIDEIIKKKAEQEKQNENEDDDNIIEIPVNTKDASSIKTNLSGDIVKKMEDNKFKLSVKTEEVEYVIPAEEIGIKKAAESMGLVEEDLKEVETEVKIEKVDEDIVKQMTEAAKKNKSEIIVPPVNFTVTAKVKSDTGEQKEVNISKFTQYVERVIKIPEGVDPEKITTGIVYNPDGTFSHVPTEVFIKDGTYYAKINSLTNSDYSVIWHPVTVASVENHWSKEAVNDMASRLVIEHEDSFMPDEAITRGEFARYITKAIGVYRTNAATENPFSDVELTNKLIDAITIASEYEIIEGYPDGTFKPDAKITREEAMTMYARVMDIVKLNEKDNNRITRYNDASDVADWAYNEVKKTISVQIFNGRTEDTIEPKDILTHAEAVTAIRNLLTEAELINR